MRRVLVFTLLIAGICLLLLTAVLANARQEQPTDIAWIYYLADEGLYVIQPDGNGQQLLSKAIRYYPVSFVTWSPDGRWLIFIDGSLNFYRVNAFNGRSEYLTNLPFPKPISEELQNNEWTHSQEWLIVYRDSALYRLRHDGSEFGLVMNDVAFPTYFDWSDDGNTFLFRATHGGSTTSFLLNIPTGELTQLTFLSNARFSLDGQWIVYVKGESINDLHLFRMRPDGTDEVMLTEGFAYGITYYLSPDGRWIIYEGCVHFDCNLYRVRLDGSDHEQLTTIGSISSVLVWLDDDTLVFTSFEDYGRKLYRLDIESGTHFVLGENVSFGYEDRFQAVAPDKQSLTYSVLDMDQVSSSLWLIPTDGDDAVQLTGAQLSAWVSAWSPDGEWLLLDGPIGGYGTDHQLFRFDLQTGDLHQLTDATNFHRFIAWSPVIELGWNARQLYVMGIIAIGVSLCAAYWFSRS